MLIFHGYVDTAQKDVICESTFEPKSIKTCYSYTWPHMLLL